MDHVHKKQRAPSIVVPKTRSPNLVHGETSQRASPKTPLEFSEPSVSDRDSSFIGPSRKPTMYPLDFDEPQFLEPAHSHDPGCMTQQATVPVALFEAVPDTFQQALDNLQESTSIAFASFSRLQQLIRERFDRLVPAKEQENTKIGEVGHVKYSEPAFFNYTNHLQAEKHYLLTEALPDWRHKAATVDREFEYACESLKKMKAKSEKGGDITVWWINLQIEVERWMEEAEDVDVPDFEETVADFKAFQAKEIRKSQARAQRNNRRVTLVLDARESKKLEKVDSGISDC